MDKKIKLVKDIALFAVGTFGPKILSFFFLPLYTSYVSTYDFGTFDLLNTIGSLLFPIVTLDFYAAVLAFTATSVRNGKITNKYLKFNFRYLKMTSIILAVGLLFYCMYPQFNGNLLYGVFIFLYVQSNFIYHSLCNFFRAIDDVKKVVLAGVICSFISLLLNVLCIAIFRMGLIGLIVANIAGIIFSNIFLYVAYKRLNMKDDSPVSTAEIKRMLVYSVPLLLSTIGWAINNSGNRILISTFASLELTGIYAVANKIPMIVTVLHSIAYQGMQLTILNEFGSKDDKSLFGKLYDIYSLILITGCFFVIAFDKVLAFFLYKNEYFIAWKYAAGLTIGVVIFSVAGYLTAILGASLRTKSIGLYVVLGAIANTALTFFLLPKYELYGAVIATIIGYAVIYFGLIHALKKELNVRLNISKFVSCVFLLLVQWAILVISDNLFVIVAYDAILFTYIMAVYMDSVKRVYYLGCELIKRITKRL